LSIIGLSDTSIAGSDQNVRSQETYPNPGRLLGESEGFPDYLDINNDRYPENTNRFKIMVGFRTGNHTGSSVPVSAEGAGALLFFGHYDQTDLFFKMSRILSLNTASLDQSLRQKLGIDIPLFNPSTQLLREQNNLIRIESAPMSKRRLLPETDTHSHDTDNEDHKN
jgi:hypothetical protein